MNLTDSIWRHCAGNPARIAITAGKIRVPYGSLRVTVENIMRQLAARGVRQGDCVAVSAAQPAAHLTILIALARMGAVSTPFDPRWPDPAKNAMLARQPVALLVCERVDTWSGEQARRLPQATPAELFAAAPAGLSEARVATECVGQVWRIALTSGTTGQSKGVPWTQGATQELQQISAQIYTSGPPERRLIRADLRIGFALGHALMQLSAGGEVVFPESGKVESVVEALGTPGPIGLVTTTALAIELANHLHKQAGQAPVPAGRVESILIGGSRVPAKVLATLRGLLTPNIRVTYGSTETGTMALATDPQPDGPDGDAGQLAPWITCQALDESGNPLEPGQTGVLRFRGPAMAGGYIGAAAGDTSGLREGWFYPGDRGSVAPDRRLVLAGRTDDVLNVGGIKVDPALIEQVLDSDEQVVESSVVVVEDDNGVRVLAAAVVCRGPLDAEKLLAHCLKSLARPTVPSRIVITEDLPRNPGGKVMRRQVETLVKARIAQGVQG